MFADIDDMTWYELREFAALFIGVAHAENPAPYMPPLPLPLNDAPTCYDAMTVFWESAPLAFSVALKEARDDIEAAHDPND